MSWADDEIAGPMGYQYCTLFPRARDALAAYRKIESRAAIALPCNICPEIIQYADILAPVSDETGLAEVPVQLYGYRQEIKGDLELDPLMTGWGRKPMCPSAIVSFGLKKFIALGHGGALLTNDQGLAEQMEGYWPFKEKSETVALLRAMLSNFQLSRRLRFDRIAAWDAALGDLLPRIPMEQVIPWRVMRRVPKNRDDLVKILRRVHIPVGTNYPPLTGRNKWGDEVINFFPECEREKEAGHIIEGALYG